jgi:hypothetical protein
MNEILDRACETIEADEPLSGRDWGLLAALAHIIQFDPVSGAVTVANGDARIILYRDGTVRIDAVRIVNAANEAIILNAPRIDLN